MPRNYDAEKLQASASNDDRKFPLMFEELKDRIDKLHALMQEPEMGLLSYSMMVGEQMNSLVKRWNGIPD